MIVGGRAKPSPQVHVDMYINRISLLVGEKNRTFSIRGIRESDGSRRLTYPIHSAGLEDCRPTTTPLAPQLISPIPPRRKAGHGSCPGLSTDLQAVPHQWQLPLKFHQRLMLLLKVLRQVIEGR